MCVCVVCVCVCCVCVCVVCVLCVCCVCVIALYPCWNPFSHLQLTHENIIKLVDLFQSPTGDLYIVTEAMVIFSPQKYSSFSFHFPYCVLFLSLLPHRNATSQHSSTAHSNTQKTTFASLSARSCEGWITCIQLVGGKEIHRYSFFWLFSILVVCSYTPMIVNRSVASRSQASKYSRQ